jgi:hypothetical protein
VLKQCGGLGVIARAVGVGGGGGGKVMFHVTFSYAAKGLKE